MITTREDLTAEEIRELAHRRWTVENQGFKALNAQCGSKHTWANDPQAFEAQMLMRLVGFNLLQVYKHERQDVQVPEEYKGVQWTLKLLVEMLSESLVGLYGYQSAGP